MPLNEIAKTKLHFDLGLCFQELAQAVAPVIPASAAKIIALIDSGEGGQPIAQPTPIFPRLELDEIEPA